MNGSALLKNKRAVVFGAGGSIGAAVARAFSAEGAEVFLAGRTKSSLDTLVRQIDESGHHAHTAVVDALDDTAVADYLDQVAEQAGGIDIEFNAIGPRAAEYGTGVPALDLPLEQFLAAQTVLTSQFITAGARRDGWLPKVRGWSSSSQAAPPVRIHRAQQGSVPHSRASRTSLGRWRSN